jgi:hypothetical protein
MILSNIAFPVMKYCRAILGELDETEDSEDAEATGDGIVGFDTAGDCSLELPFEAEASAKSSGRFKALRTSTMSSYGKLDFILRIRLQIQIWHDSGAGNCVHYEAHVFFYTTSDGSYFSFLLT